TAVSEGVTGCGYRGGRAGQSRTGCGYRGRCCCCEALIPGAATIVAWERGRGQGRKRAAMLIAALYLLVRRLFLNIYEDIVAFDLDLKPGYVTHGGEAQHLAVPDVKARAVPGALDLVAVEFALGQRATVVCAQVLDGVELPADVEHGDEQPVVGFDNNALARGELVYLRNLDEVGHGRVS